MRLLPALVILLGLALPATALELPRPRGYVTDQAGILDAATVGQLDDFLRRFEESDSTQIAVLTLPSLEGEALEEVALKVAESWKIGQRGRDNGALLLIAKEERKIRIEVGRGLEGRLTDLLAGRIVDNEIRPRFKQGDFRGGIVAGVRAMSEAVRGEYQGTGRTAKKKEAAPWWIFPLIFLGIPFLLRLGGSSSAVHGRRHGGHWIGGPPMGGGFGGGGGGFGGFSGGGGGFSGGGASGDW